MLLLKLVKYKYVTCTHIGLKEAPLLKFLSPGHLLLHPFDLIQLQTFVADVTIDRLQSTQEDSLMMINPTAVKM